MDPRSHGVLDTPLEPVIGLAEAETRWRSMTVLIRATVRSYCPKCRTAHTYSAASTAFAISAVPLRPPNSIGLMPSA
jgi:hypothetical protein